MESFGTFWKMAGEFEFGIEIEFELNLDWIWIKLEGPSFMLESQM